MWKFLQGAAMIPPITVFSTMLVSTIVLTWEAAREHWRRDQ